MREISKSFILVTDTLFIAVLRTRFSTWLLQLAQSLCKHVLIVYEVWLMIFTSFQASLIWLASAATYWVNMLDVVHRQLMASTVVMYIDWAFLWNLFMYQYICSVCRLVDMTVLFCSSQNLIPSNWLWSLWTLSGIKSLCKHSVTVYEVELMIFAPFRLLWFDWRAHLLAEA